MSWTALTSADVDDYLVAAKADALRTAALRSGQTDTIARILADVTSYVRLCVTGCRRNQVDTDTTKIPFSLRTQALDIVIYRLHMRLEVALKDERKDANDRAEKILSLVRKCEHPIDETPAPAADSGAQQSGGIETATASPTRQATAARLNGI